jgi:hypothetical protein
MGADEADALMHRQPVAEAIYQLRLWAAIDLRGACRATVHSGTAFLCRPSWMALWAALATAGRAVSRVMAGAAGSGLSILMILAGRYRPLTADEVRDARAVFGDALDTSRIHVSTDDLMHRLIFGFQLRCAGGHRVFVTNNLVHAPYGAPLRRHVLIHELTHVWQSRVMGPSYICAAVHAQLWGEGYNYGYEEDRTLRVWIPVDHADGSVSLPRGEALGEGAQPALAVQPFEAFNVEQQGQIVMHYFVRRVLLGQSETQCLPWTKRVEHVRAVGDALASRSGRAVR